ncbi:T6SS effector BTH_I2691 family protein [Pseudomonas sp. 43(2021)]|uniref:T6SS effector BTH_I2691 family protein n=1 Tax=Pseudomonas sp. 43(2021) TaxID=2813560 RepID=UPI001A9FBA3F|nr:T6SS effector BTH_I2691 family protein [Pseudomonas sp. 43(2021)]
MTISQRIALAIAEAGLPHDQCMSCERQGLPILPLRRALVPDTRPGCVSTVADNRHISTKIGLRTLRRGYLYVLLYQQVWHAYAVSEQGHLRRFNPYEPPDGPPSPLPEKCVNADHDIPSAFLNIDTSRYASAWLAFSSDPWPVSVLNAYKSGASPAHRFEGLDLIQARSNPELLGIAMTPDKLGVDQQVFEYAQHGCAPFDSAHGFHSRWLRRFALRGYLVNAINRHKLENGVLAVVLDDTVGLIQEYNHQRLNWVLKRQAWREEPMRAYQLQTSQILQIIRATHREWAAQKVPSLEPMTGDGPPVFTDPAVERQLLVERAQQESDERLEERYHEPQRAAFQAEYEQQEREFQRYIDKDAKAYAALFDTPMFKVAEAYDYDGNDRESGVAYAKTMALCLGGGVTEAVVLRLEPHVPASGTSELLWLKWLQDPDSPPYRALLMRDQSLLAGLLPSFSATEAINWNDSDKLYGMLSKIIASDDAGLRMRNTLKQAIAETQGALNAASQRLAPCLSPGIQKAVRHLNSATQFLYNGVHLIELEVKMKLGEYYALQSAHLRELQHKANASIAEARDRMRRNIDDFEFGSMKAMRKVRPIIQHGLMSLAVLDPRLTNTMISVTVWVEGKAEEVHGRLFKEVSMGVTQASSAAQLALVDISVAAGTLETDARRLLQGMKITTQQAARLVRTGFSGLRGIAGSWEVLLAIGGLYLQQDSLGRNQEKAETEIGPKAYEAKLALQGSYLGVLGGHIELVGLMLRASAYKGMPWAKGATATGETLIKIGAVVGAVVGFVEAAQAVSAAKRVSAAGDGAAAIRYWLAAGFYGASAIAVAGTALSSTVLGPVGLAVVLALTAYTLSKSAEENESSALERWARRCCFGKADETPVIHWRSPEYADIAFAELNAATLGVQAEFHFESNLVSDPATPRIGGLTGLERKQKIKFKIILPQYKDGMSAYRWCLTVHRLGDGQFPDYTGGETLVVDEFHARRSTGFSKSASFPGFSPPRLPDYKGDFNIDKKYSSFSEGNDRSQLAISGLIELMPTIGAHSIVAATLLVMYWPDREIESAYIEVCNRRANDDA